MANERGYIKIWTEFVYKVKAKVNFALEQAMKALTGNYSIALLFNLGATFGGWLTPHSGRFTPGKENRYPLHRKLCGCGKPGSHRHSIPAPSSPYRVTIPTEQSRPSVTRTVWGQGWFWLLRIPGHRRKTPCYTVRIVYNGSSGVSYKDPLYPMSVKLRFKITLKIIPFNVRLSSVLLHIDTDTFCKPKSTYYILFTFSFNNQLCPFPFPGPSQQWTY